MDPATSAGHGVGNGSRRIARKLVEAVVTRYGGQCTTAASAVEALGILETLRPDVIVSDIAMPGTVGHAFIREVRAGESADSRIPAIALTAQAGDNDSREARAAGYDVHLAKPFDPEALIGAIATQLGRP